MTTAITTPMLEPPFDARVSGSWLTISAPDHGRPVMGAPGPWKHGLVDGAPMLICDLPATLDTGDPAWDEDDWNAETSQLDRLTEWACVCYRGVVNADWSTPEPDQLRELLPEADRDLALRRGTLMEPARFTTEPDGRLALGVTLATVSPDLGTPRRQWLDRAIAGADGLRLVRVGLADGTNDATVVRAEVDFSGAPRWAVPTIARAGFSALKCIYSAFAPTFSVIGDTAWSSTTLTTRDPDEPFSPFTPSSV
jgi:hypothetical protein